MSNPYLPLVGSKRQYHPNDKTQYTFHIYRSKKFWETATLKDVEGALAFFEGAKQMLEDHQQAMQEFYDAKLSEINNQAKP